MQSEDTSAIRDPLKEACLCQGCLGELVIKGPARLTALAKPCSLLGRDAGFIGSRVEEKEARINRKYRNVALKNPEHRESAPMWVAVFLQTSL